MMPPEFEEKLQKYADLTIRVGLNLQPGQRLLIRGIGSTIQAAPLIRRIASSAYRAGARFVDVMWSDDQLELMRFENAPRDSFDEYPAWRANGMLEYAKRGDALLSIAAIDPNLLDDQDPDLVAVARRAAAQHLYPVQEHRSRGAMNWCLISAAAPGWAAKVFPDFPRQEREARLWNAIFEICRLDRADPIAAWQEHIRHLVARKEYLTHKQYTALRFAGPGTDLTVGLVQGHVWRGGQTTSETGIAFTPHLPTEEVFTLPHKDVTAGIVRASKPLPLMGTLVENLSLTFAGGRVVNVTADRGEAVLRKLIETDEGASRLGEVALVPNSSPISQSGLLFYNTLFDESTASHVALGNAKKVSLQGGAAMSKEAFAIAGGNQSLLHIDFTIGSGEMDVDGVTADSTAEPLMRDGEWTFEI